MSDSPEQPPKVFDTMDHIDKINAKRQSDLDTKVKIEEAQIEYKKALNGLAQTPNGQLFLKKLIIYSGVFSAEDEVNPVKLYEENGRKKLYLKLIRPFLEPQIRAELEN